MSDHQKVPRSVYTGYWKSINEPGEGDKLAEQRYTAIRSEVILDEDRGGSARSHTRIDIPCDHFRLAVGDKVVVGESGYRVKDRMHIFNLKRTRLDDEEYNAAVRCAALEGDVRKPLPRREEMWEQVLRVFVERF